MKANELKKSLAVVQEALSSMNERLLSQGRRITKLEAILKQRVMTGKDEEDVHDGDPLLSRRKRIAEDERPSTKEKRSFARAIRHGQRGRGKNDISVDEEAFMNTATARAFTPRQ